jgi:phosphatidate phosphatase PAH1
MSREYYFGDEARVQCYKGYKLTGSNIIKCSIGQEFLNPPKCEGESSAYLVKRKKSRMETVHIAEKSAHKSTKTWHKHMQKHKDYQANIMLNSSNINVISEFCGFCSGLMYEQNVLSFYCLTAHIGKIPIWLYVKKKKSKAVPLLQCR